MINTHTLMCCCCSCCWFFFLFPLLFSYISIYFLFLSQKIQVFSLRFQVMRKLKLIWFDLVWTLFDGRLLPVPFRLSTNSHIISLSLSILCVNVCEADRQETNTAPLLWFWHHQIKQIIPVTNWTGHFLLLFSHFWYRHYTILYLYSE